MLTKNSLPSYFCLPLLCSISHCKDPFMSKSAWPGDTHLSHTATSYTQLGLTQDFPSECGKLTAAGRRGRQWRGTEQTGSCAACDAASPRQVPGKTAPPRPAANSMPCHKSTLLCLRTANLRGCDYNPASTTAASCLMTIKALKQEEMGWGLHRAKRRPSKYRSNHLSPSQQQTSLESLCCRHTMPDKSSTLRHRGESSSAALTTGIHPHTPWMVVGTVLKKKMVGDEGYIVPAFMGFTIYFIMRLAFADVIPRST